MGSGCPFAKKYPSALQRDDEYFMAMAYNQALVAWDRGEVPVGAVAIFRGEIVGSAYNAVAMLNDPTAHAEMQVITQAAGVVGDWRLNDVTIYATKEPCPMCSGAIIMARVGTVVFGASDAKMGCLGGSFAMQNLAGINHRPAVRAGVLGEECLSLLHTFFELRRNSPTESSDGTAVSRAHNHAMEKIVVRGHDFL
jgi:tRNA(adenine34) deaminase